MIDLIDISSIQYPVDFSHVKRAGFRGVYIKSSQYSRTLDHRFGELRKRAEAEGLAVGAYHFCSQSSASTDGGVYMMTDPQKQMEFFYEASGCVGSIPGDLPPMIDWEFCTKPTSKECVAWLAAAAEAATKLWYPQNDSVKARNEPSFIERLPVIYTYPDFSNRHQPELSGSGVGKHPLCYASYKSKYDPIEKKSSLVPWYPEEGQAPLHPIPQPWTKATLWQYSGNNGLPVTGVSGSCDRQLFLGTEGEWKDFLGLPRPKSFFEGTANSDIL